MGCHLQAFHILSIQEVSVFFRPVWVQLLSGSYTYMAAWCPLVLLLPDGAYNLSEFTWIPIYLSRVVNKACNMGFAKKKKKKSIKQLENQLIGPRDLRILNGTRKLLSVLFCLHLLTACFQVKSETSKVLSRLGKRSTCSMLHPPVVQDVPHPPVPVFSSQRKLASGGGNRQFSLWTCDKKLGSV